MLLRNPKLVHEIQAVFTDHQSQAALEIGSARQRAQPLASHLQLVRRGAGLHLGLGSDQRQTIDHPEGGVAGALCQLPPPRQHHLQLQPTLLRQQISEIELQQLECKT